MANEDDLLGQNLSDEDLTFLRHADGFRGAFEKIKEAKRLIAEARAEIRVLVGGEVVASAKKAKGKKTKAPSVQYAANAPDELTAEQQKVLAAIGDGDVQSPDVQKGTGYSKYVVKRVLSELRDRRLVKLTGAGRGATWSRA